MKKEEAITNRTISPSHQAEDAKKSIDDKQENRRFKKPVAWLLGPQLLNSAKGILLYLAYGKKLDPRDWMWADAFPSRDRAKALNVWRLLYDHKKAKEADDAAKANPMSLDKDEKEKDKKFWDAKNEFWFDYISDTGDGMKATYSIAYLCLSDLYVHSHEPDELATGTHIRTHLTKSKDPADKLLPRGQFLFVGGDTAYHVSDYMTLGERFQAPFKWAYEDLCEDLKVTTNISDQPNRPIFGIPGNHDYYDQLDGFRRQFRRSVREEKLRGALEDPPKNESMIEERLRLSTEPQLFLPGFIRKQQASYVALRLPFDWWIWGLDTEVGQIDERQWRFFRDLCKDNTAPKKLIVATCSPTTVFGKIATPQDEKATDAFLQLDLSRPFLPEKRDDGEVEKPVELGDNRLEADQCRLDISGDVHHYARYWGPKPKTVSDPGNSKKRTPMDVRPDRDTDESAPEAKSYASVVSGIGGAFHHPSRTYLGEIKEQALYPSETVSTDKVAKRLFNPVNILRGGYVGLAGFLISFAIYFAATVTPSSRDFVNSFFLLLSHKTWGETLKIIFLKFESALLLASLAPLLYGILGNRPFGKASGGSKGKDTKVPVKPGSFRFIDPEIHASPQRWLWPVSAFSILALYGGLYMTHLQISEISDFGKSAVILLSIVWAVLAISLSFRYSEFLFKKAHKDNIHWYHWAPTYLLTVFSVINVFTTLWFFGDNLRPANLVSDMIFTLILAGVVIGVTALPAVGGGELFKSKRSKFDDEMGYVHTSWEKFKAAVPSLGIGLWHCVLQIATPIVLVIKGSILTWIVLVIWLAVMGLLGKRLLANNYRVALLLTWLCAGALSLALPFFLSPAISSLAEPIFMGEWTGWWGYLPKSLAPPFAAGLFGVATACVWLGWYFAVCFAFNGHNNEVGGACRIEEFKQFIRFKLTPNGLTAYVIGIDRPEESGRKLKPQIVDCFELKVKA